MKVIYFVASTFLEFWKLYETDHALEKQWLEPATESNSIFIPGSTEASTRYYFQES